ncbi:MAG: DUF1153 domain-containing protein [Alphaproteobacteria bacterium]|nr:DUF1153 domain-containing protein [Alphaproteobacteria bacterium]
MGSSSVRPVSQVIGPGGNILTFDNLPPKNTRRWVPRRKAEVIAAVDGGLLTLTEACTRYAISHEEFSSWIQAYARHGLPGLRAGQLMDRWTVKEDAATPFTFEPDRPVARAATSGKITN